MRIYDLSQKLIPGPSQFPGDPPICMQTISDIEADGYRLELFSAGTHAGTHVDLPAHLYAEGKSVEMVPVAAFVGRTMVLWDSGGIGKEKLEQLPSHLEIVLLASEQDQIWLEEEGAEYLVGKVKGVGIQSPSIDPLESAKLPAHRILLGAGIWIAENLNFAQVPQTEFFYVGPPLLLSGAGAAWARPVGIVG